MAVQSTQVLADRIIFQGVERQRSLPMLLTANPENIFNGHDGKRQTIPEAPVVMVNDLAAGSGLASAHGTKVSMTLIHELTEVGGTEIKDRGLEYAEQATDAKMEIEIANHHKSTKQSLKDYQQAVGYDRTKLLRPLLERYHAKITEEHFLYKIMGARGTRYEKGVHLLPVSGQKLTDELVTPLRPPTFRSKMYAGNAKSIDASDGLTAITANDVLKYSDIGRVREAIDMRSQPMQPIKLDSSDKWQNSDPFWVWYITPKQWTTLQASMLTDGYNQLVANALARTNGFNHPLFMGEMLFAEGILIKKYFKPVGWSAGQSIPVSQDQNLPDPQAQVVPSGVIVERSFLLGGKALGFAYGNAVKNGWKGNFDYSEKDDEATLGAWRIAWMDAMYNLEKITFASETGRVEDRGVHVIDTAVPA